ncbi:hypothetical protein O181_065996 [Austropuccinia psidii MF-1]|uniref:Uncharacterized protein n=1 Tax=Austropuccinia psidii MF-1 TaxID=1389203 RepID=A0A9Q3EWQ6_9BASI|nr:hypothetical protein [Austropuccinia psidii MF-1]
MRLTSPSHWPDTYAPAGPSRGDYNASPHLRPHHPCLFVSLAYNSYTPAVPSRYASDNTPSPLTPNLFSAAYHSCAQVQWLVGVHDERNQGDMLSGHLCQHVLWGNW